METEDQVTAAIGDWGAWQLRYSRENSSGTAERTDQVQQGEQLRYSRENS
jgi:hypothetical protein